MSNDRLQTVSTLLVTLALLLFAYLLVLKAIDLALLSERVSPETLTVGIMGFANIIIMAAVARWLQQGAQQSAERAATQLQKAVATVKNGQTPQEHDTEIPTDFQPR